MSASKASEESIKVIQFDGSNEDDWRMWNAKLRAVGMIKRWVKALDKKPDPEIDFENPKDDVEKMVIKSENDAIMYLTLTCHGVAFKYIIGKDTAHEMYTSLKDRYEPEDVDDYVELLQKFQDCKIEREVEDPEVWFHKLEHQKHCHRRV